MKKMNTLTVNGNAYTLEDASAVSFAGAQSLTEEQKIQARNNIGAAALDDTAVGTDTWSSDHIVRQLCPPFTAAGGTVTCEPVAGYPLEVVSRFAAGTADAPVELYRLGKNLLCHYSHSTTTNGITFTVNADKSITANGTATANSFFYLYGIQPVPAASYILSGCPAGGGDNTYRMWLKTDDMYFRDCGEGVPLAISGKIQEITVLIIAGMTVKDLVFRPMLRLAGVTSADYAPYTGDKFTWETDGTFPLAGGTYNWTTGVFTAGDGSVRTYPSQRIPALPGVNTLYSTAGETAVTGRADPAAVMTDLQNRLNALQALAVNNA